MEYYKFVDSWGPTFVRASSPLAARYKLARLDLEEEGGDVIGQMLKDGVHLIPLVSSSEEEFYSAREMAKDLLISSPLEENLYSGRDIVCLPSIVSHHFYTQADLELMESPEQEDEELGPVIHLGHGQYITGEEIPDRAVARLFRPLLQEMEREYKEPECPKHQSMYN